MESGLAILVWLVVGAAVGVAACLVLRIESGAWRLLNLGAGMAGAVGGGIAEGHGAIADDPLKTSALIVAAAGAVILTGIVNLFRRT